MIEIPLFHETQSTVEVLAKSLEDALIGELLELAADEPGLRFGVLFYEVGNGLGISAAVKLDGRAFALRGLREELYRGHA